MMKKNLKLLLSCLILINYIIEFNVYTQNQKKLIKIAQQGETVSVRIDAVKQLDKDLWQKLFVDIVKNDSIDELRYEAFIKLDTSMWKDLIVESVKNDPYLQIRLAALKMIDSEKFQSLYTDLFLDINQPFEIRKSAFNQIFNDKELTRIAKNTNEKEYYFQSIEKIKEDSLLYDILLNVSDLNDKEYIIQRIHEEQILAEIILNPDYEIFHDKLISSINNEEMLINIICNSNSYNIKHEALLKVNNQSFFSEIVKNEESYLFRKIAIIKLDSVQYQELFKEIALNDQDAIVRIEAIKKMNEERYQEVFMQIVNNDPIDEVKQEALKKITDQVFINNIILAQKKYLLPVAISKTNNEEILFNYAIDPAIAPQNRCIAISRLTNQEIIAKLARNDRNEDVRITALKFLDEMNYRNQILEIGIFDRKDYIRDEALKKLFPEKWQYVSDEINLIRYFAAEEGKSVDQELKMLQQELLKELNINSN